MSSHATREAKVYNRMGQTSARVGADPHADLLTGSERPVSSTSRLRSAQLRAATGKPMTGDAATDKPKQRDDSRGLQARRILSHRVSEETSTTRATTFAAALATQLPHLAQVQHLLPSELTTSAGMVRTTS